MSRLGRFRQPSVIPGFGLTLGFTLAYFSLIILVPLVALVLRSAGLGWSGFWTAALDARVLASLRTSFLTATIAAGINVVFGTLIAWVLVRYRFPGRRIFDAMVDLPFALPTAVAGIALTAIYAPNGIVGQFAAQLGSTSRPICITSGRAAPDCTNCRISGLALARTSTDTPPQS